MADKEPRRRKKRKDLQSARKEDLQSDDALFTSTKMEVKDSDQEVEEEVSLPSHQPSVFAKFVFVMLFSALIVSMSFVFISLQGTHRNEVDIFEDHHAEGSEILHDIHEADHDEEEHADAEHGDEEHDEPDHDDTPKWSLSKASFQENIEALLPGIGSILSFKDEPSKESEDVEEQESSIEENVKEKESADEEAPELINMKFDEATSMQDDIDEDDDMEDNEDLDDDEDLISSQIPTQKPPEVATTQKAFKVETSSKAPEREHISSKTSPLQENDDDDDVMTSPNTNEDSDYSTYSPNTVPKVDEDDTEDNVLMSNLERLSDEQSQEESNFIENVVEDKDEELPFYEKEDITNEADYEIRRQLDELEEALEKFPDRTLKKCEELLQSHKDSPRLHYIRAQALDKLADSQRSNQLLEDAIAEYKKVMDLQSAPEKLYLLAGKRAADRMRFRGFMGKSLTLLLEMAAKFPRNVEIQNLVAVGYLMIGRNKEAKKVLYEVLKISPDSGFAKVHLGFILKTDDSDYNGAIKFLSEGLATREPGVIDGRFYFHLGDSLHRIGKQDKALEVYNEAVKEGLFLSAYQRSLYNVKGLSGKPWWNPQSITYAPYFKLLEKNWQTIRDEALSLTNEKVSAFMPESEGLQDKGDWKQFELFARGKKIEKNCLKTPKTCALISQMPDAANCKRGQVKFSIMQPSTHVWAHTGPTNCRLRSHLGLVVPDGVAIRVADETRSWEEGKVILFDDSFEHEVWHKGNSSRLILIVDFWHPELTAYQKKSLTPI